MAGQPQIVYPPQGGGAQVPQQIVILTQPAHSNSQRRGNVVLEDFKGKRSIRMGWALIVFGILAILFSTGNIVVQGNREYPWGNYCVRIGAGIWCGTFYIISGGLSIGAGQRKTTSMIRGNIAMGVFGTMFGFIDMSLAIATLAQESHKDYNNGWGPYGSHEDDEDKDEDLRSTTMGLAVMSMLCAMAAIGLCIAASELSGRVLCKGQHVTPTQSGAIQTIQGGQIQTIQGGQIQTIHGTQIPTIPGGSGHQVMVLNIPPAGQQAAFQNQAMYYPQTQPQNEAPPPGYEQTMPAGELPQKEFA